MDELLTLVDWKSFSISQFPQLFVGLFADDQKVRNLSYSQIQQLILYRDCSFEDVERGYGLSKILKDNLHEVIVPLLIQSLHQNNVGASIIMLEFLTQIIEFIHFHDINNETKERAIRLRYMVWAGLGTYLNLLKIHNSQLVEAVILLLSKYEEYFHHTEPIFLKFLNISDNKEMKANILWNVYTLFASHKKDVIIGILEGFLAEENSLTLNLTASFCLVDLLKNNAPTIAKENMISYVLELKQGLQRVFPPGYEKASTILEGIANE